MNKPTITIHTIAKAWQATDAAEEGITMDRQQMATQLRALLKLPAERDPARVEEIPAKEWEEYVAAPFRATYRLAYLQWHTDRDLDAEEKHALGYARTALFRLKGKAKITITSDVAPAKAEAPAKAKAKPGAKKKLQRCPCCEAMLHVVKGQIVEAPKEAA
jgi:hypothetical protein